MPQLLNRHTGGYEDVDLITPIQQQDIQCFQNDWLPPINHKIAELKANGTYTLDALKQANILDAHWDWPTKFGARAGALEWNSFALRAAGRTQALMFVNLVHRGRLPSQINQHLVYVDLLATAPWNRKGFSTTPLYRGAGEILMTEAILLSRDEGFEGRIGLHSLPGAEDFYADTWLMESLGLDPAYQNLEYFELTQQKASNLLDS